MESPFALILLMPPCNPFPDFEDEEEDEDEMQTTRKTCSVLGQ